MSGTRKPYRIDQIDMDRIRYSEVKGQGNRRCVFLRYDDPQRGEEKLRFQTTELFNTNDVVSKGSLWELDVPLYGKSVRKTEKLIDFLRKLDEKFVSDGRENLKEWFGNNRNIRYKSIIRTSYEPDEYTVNGMIKLKIGTAKSSEATDVTLNGRQSIDASQIKGNSHLKMILECNALWLTDEGFGLYLKPLLIDYRPIADIKFLEDSDEDDIPIYDTEMEPSGGSNHVFIDTATEVTEEGDVQTLPDTSDAVQNVPVTELAQTTVATITVAPELITEKKCEDGSCTDQVGGNCDDVECSQECCPVDSGDPFVDTTVDQSTVAVESPALQPQETQEPTPETLEPESPALATLEPESPALATLEPEIIELQMTTASEVTATLEDEDDEGNQEMTDLKLEDIDQTHDSDEFDDVTDSD